MRALAIRPSPLSKVELKKLILPPCVGSAFATSVAVMDSVTLPSVNVPTLKSGLPELSIGEVSPVKTIENVSPNETLFSVTAPVPSKV
jgi:hypothetical protein